MENILENPDGYREYILDFPLEDIHSIVQEWCGRYDRKFRKLAAEQRSINYAAGFFGAVWAAYRGMWKMRSYSLDWKPSTAFSSIWPHSF